MSIPILFNLMFNSPVNPHSCPMFNSSCVVWQDESVRNEVDYQMCRNEHPALSECHDKYCSRSDPLDRKQVLTTLKQQLDDAIEKTAQNCDESEVTADHLMKTIRRLRQESESRSTTDQELEQNQQMMLTSYSQYLDMSLELMEKYRIPYKNKRDECQSYVLNSRVQTEGALSKKKTCEHLLSLCPDAEHVNQRKQQFEEMDARVTGLEAEKSALLSRRAEIEDGVDAGVVQEFVLVLEDLTEKEWAVAQLHQP